MTKINVFVFAAHHLSGNIAAQRFKGLLKYLDPAKYRIFVFAREPASGAATTPVTPERVAIFPLPGHCVGSESSAASSLLVLAAAFLRPLPFLLAGNAKRGRPWLVEALAEADRLCAERLATGERCVVIGSYSPIDALIAAASLASGHGIGCLQDFLDGLAAITDDEVAIGVSGELDPAVLRPAGSTTSSDRQFLAVIMPMRI